VSAECKNLIRQCLKTNPEERPNINQVIESPWISRYDVVPDTPLVTSSVLREESDTWQEVQDGMSVALQEMRVDQDTGMMLKNPKQNSNSALVKKRMAAKMKNQSPIQEESMVENEDGTHL